MCSHYTTGPSFTLGSPHFARKFIGHSKTVMNPAR